MQTKTGSPVRARCIRMLIPIGDGEYSLIEVEFAMWDANVSGL